MADPQPIDTVQLDDVKAAASIIGGKWKTAILYCLSKQPLRFAALRRAVGTVSEKVLAQHLRELEAEGLVHREVRHTVPPQVEYSMTAHGKSLCGVIEAISSWGRKHRLKAARTRG